MNEFEQDVQSKEMILLIQLPERWFPLDFYVTIHNCHCHPSIGIMIASVGKKDCQQFDSLSSVFVPVYAKSFRWCTKNR